MFALLLLLQSPSSDIIVTGQRLVEVQAECARGDCTPLRDAQATIALAEEKFRGGAYLDAKRLLSAAIGRNRDKGAIAPRPVAALYEAMATVSLHEGDQNDYRRAVAHQVAILRDNLPPDDVAVLSATTALGDMWIKLRNYRQAESTYRGIEQAALADGRAYAAMMAGMKRVWLAAAMDKPREANQMLNELERRPIAQEPGFRTALRVVRLRIAARGGDDGAITRLVGEIAEDQDTGPILIWAPPYASNAAADANAQARSFGAPDPVPVRSSDLASIQWIDVGFWIRPDGRTEEAEILRGSRTPGWAPTILAQIAQRRYSTHPDAKDADAAGTYRIERVTHRSVYVTPTGSHIRRRVAASGFEVLDLTQASAASPPT
ncbi:hypothetical protein MOK15_01345 [Sphingobium sp. BYY-5]|uniref:tetratricopeptide repeat protein n=1 Tax=Sphingobium sp. BYY-5 TaxID=2926400 RepID=UPI001FA7A288|nr:hypothetical protein [Sphingobium sp. BYY-5]MCI4588753.1 hypothetical protein [Sphingobium sp. BYY-5]